MSKTIHKFPLSTSIHTDACAKVLMVGDQNGQPFVWLEVDPAAPKTDLVFAVVGTGHPVPDGFFHVGSWLSPPFVWHLYQAGLAALNAEPGHDR